MMKNNHPIRQPASYHIRVVVASLVGWSGLIVGAVGANNFLDVFGTVAIVLSTYIVYLCVSCNCSEAKEYLQNMKAFMEYKEMYDKMVKGEGFFRFWIECYHHESRGSGKRRRSVKVVTHTAEHKFLPAKSEDDSGNLTGINDITSYVFVDYEKRYYFTEAQSADIVNKAYQNFIFKNKRDKQQSYSMTFEIVDFEGKVGFCAEGSKSLGMTGFVVSTLLLMTLPYSCIVERWTSRYSINIVKRLTYK